MNEPNIATIEVSASGILNSLLRGEIAAAETYQQALEGLDHVEGADPLRLIQQNHGSAIGYLRKAVATNGGEASTKSGVWGIFARAIEGAALVIGDRAALSSLLEGEHQGLASYKAAATNLNLSQECRSHIDRVLIPKQRRHIETLSRLIAKL
jgi:hypothetical protein